MGVDGYNPFKLTALKRSSLSVPIRKLYEKGLLKGKILDYGCGHGTDVGELIFKLVNIKGYDKYNEEFKDQSLLEDTYDVVTCNYVLNVIPDLKEHREVTELLKKLGNEVYISVRADKKAVKDTWEYIEEYDCYLTPKGSYQRFYGEEMIERYFGKVEYLINNSSLKLIKLINN